MCRDHICVTLGTFSRDVITEPFQIKPLTSSATKYLQTNLTSNKILKTLVGITPQLVTLDFETN